MQNNIKIPDTQVFNNTKTQDNSKILNSTNPLNNTKTYTSDVLIIGAGPVGLFSAYQAGLLGMQSIIVDALEEIGGQLSALYPEKYIYDIPGFPKVLAKNLVENLIVQANGYKPLYLLNQITEGMQKTEQGFRVNTSLGNIIEAKVILIAAGAGAFGPNRPPMKGIELFENKSVFYMVKDPKSFQNQNIVIAGGGDSAVDWAIILADIAKKVYVVHRRDNFRAAPASITKLRELATDTSKVELVIPYMPKELVVENNTLIGIEIASLAGEQKVLEADCFLAFFGLARHLGGLENWGFTINKMHSSIEVNSSYETNIPGIFAVGDIAQYEYKLKLIMVGFSESAYALHAAWKYVFPDKKFHFVHSTAKQDK